MTPVFTVIIPTHNRSNLLKRAVNSVMNQTFKEFELIIVDDASTDNTQDEVASIKDVRLRYIRRSTNGGPSATRNDGIREARGELIAFLDDDDEYLPNFLEKTLYTFRGASSEVGFGWCGVAIIRDREDGEHFVCERIRQPKYKNRQDAYLSFLKSTPRVGSGYGLTIRTQCFEKVGLFDESIRTSVDADFLMRIVQHYDFIVTPEVLVKVHNHTGPKVNLPTPQRALAYEHIMKKHLPVLRQHPKIQAAFQTRTAVVNYKIGNVNHARELLKLALLNYPLYQQGWMTLVLFEFRHLQSLLRKALSLKKERVS